MVGSCLITRADDPLTHRILLSEGNTVEFDVLVEIPKGSRNKYEVDHETGRIRLDRMLFTSTAYPEDYGYIENTLGLDGDPLDALVILQAPTFPGCLIRCRAIGMLKMTDEAGSDEKLVVIPSPKVFPGYAHINDMKGVSPHWLERTVHFCEHYKDLEKGKWVKVAGWVGAEEAKTEITAGIARYQAEKKAKA